MTANGEFLGCINPRSNCYLCEKKDYCEVRDKQKVLVLRKGVLTEGKRLTHNIHGYTWIEFPDGNELVLTKELMSLEVGNQSTLDLAQVFKGGK